MINRLLTRIKVVQLVYANWQAGTPTIDRDLALLQSFEASQQLFNTLLALIVRVTDCRREAIETARSKFFPTDEERHPNMRFVDNRLAEAIRTRSSVMEYCETNGLLSDFDTALYRSLFADIERTEAYASYMATPPAADALADLTDDALRAKAFKQDKQLWKHLVQTVFAQSQQLDEMLESRNIYWNDDLATVIAYVGYCIDKIQDDDEPIAMPKTFNDPGEERFARDLYHHALDDAHDLLPVIDRAAANWNVERIGLIERVILVCALAEIRHMADIATSISINEYVELAKHYGSAGSGRFVNGLLDTIVKQWKEQHLLLKA